MGFLGSYLVPRLLEQKNNLILLVRNQEKKSALDRVREKFGDDRSKNIEVVDGDLQNIWVPSSLCNYRNQIDVLLHAAALLNLGTKKRAEIWETNYEGTKNVISFCQKNFIKHISFISTAYTQGRNDYEITKEKCESELKDSGMSHTIIKPSIIIGSPDDPGPGQTINQFALAIIKIHMKAESTRGKMQNGLALPQLELGLRVKGDPQSTLNVIPVANVTGSIIKILDKQGTYYVTNPNPPTTEQVSMEVGEALGIHIHIKQQFRSSPIEKMLHKVVKSFLPYLQNEPQFPTVVDKDFVLRKGYLSDMVKSFLKKV